VATIKFLEKDYTLMGIYLDIQESEFFPVLKSKIPQSYYSLDLFSRLFVKK
jgi:hypothetical protein